MQSFYNWKRELNSQDFHATLFSDPFKGGYHVNKWQPRPRPLFREAYIRGTGVRSIQNDNDWYLPETDVGGVTFTVKNSPDQLMIDLGGTGRSDMLYHTIVIGRGPSPAGVYKKQIKPTIIGMFFSYPDYTYLPLEGTIELDTGYYLPDTPVNLWMTYINGQITVGEGPAPDTGRVLLRATDPRAAPGVQQVGFGAWRNSDDRTSTISNINFWSYHPTGTGAGRLPFP